DGPGCGQILASASPRSPAARTVKTEVSDRRGEPEANPTWTCSNTRPRPEWGGRLGMTPYRSHHRGSVPHLSRGLRADAASLRAEARGLQLVGQRRPIGQQRAGVPRVDDLLDVEHLGGPERRAHGVEA